MTPGSVLAGLVWASTLWAQGGDGGVADNRPAWASRQLAERAVPQVATSVATTEKPPRTNAVDQDEYRRVEPRVHDCRIEIARRRHVPASRVAAKSVTLRWTIEPSGRVRDAEAVLAPQTDTEVAACAKRVISESVFGKHAGGPQTIEWTYTFP
jgi:hypothetical protein